MPKNGVVTLTFFELLFQKTLLMIGMENNLQFVDLPPNSEDNCIPRTLAMIQFHRNYMANVFKQDKKI